MAAAAPGPALSDHPAQVPILAGIVVHWRSEDDLAGLLRSWPAGDPRFELVVVDNGSAGPLPAPLSPTSAGASAAVRLLQPGRNLGFGGGVNAGLAATRAPLVLILNPDAWPEPGALDALLAGFAAHPDAAGLAPRLIGPDGTPQWRWQLRPLPGLGRLLAQALFLPAAGGPRREPPAGARIGQPAAAALALRRSALEMPDSPSAGPTEAPAMLGSRSRSRRVLDTEGATSRGASRAPRISTFGFDERFHPAWFEDVDLARRLAGAGRPLLYWPAAVFRHRLGGSVPALGYGRFLWIYYRNLARYLRKHHGPAAAAAVRALLPVTALLRLVLVPLRRPRRAASRSEAAAGLLTLAAGALTGWRRPAAWAAAVESSPAPLPAAADGAAPTHDDDLGRDTRVDAAATFEGAPR